VTDHNLRDAVKLKLDDEGPNKWIIVPIGVTGSSAWMISDPYDSPSHAAFHRPAEEWEQQMLERIAQKSLRREEIESISHYEHKRSRV
jgi:hypothetical protein